MRFTGVLLFLLLAMSINSASWADASLLYEIEIERADQETRVYLKTDGPIKDYRKFQLKKNVEANRPDRMYLDLNNMDLAAPIPVKEVGTALARVRTGKRSDGIRVVFDSNLDGLFEYKINEEPGSLLVTVLEPFVDIMDGEESGIEIIYPEPNVAGDLNLVIVNSDLPDQARGWLKASSADKIGLELLKAAKPDQEISTSFLVTGLTPDIDGNYFYQISFTLLDPFGNPRVNRRNYIKGTGKAPTHPAFIMAEPELALVLDSSDPLGDYTIIGIVEDLINNKMFRTSRQISLTR